MSFQVSSAGRILLVAASLCGTLDHASAQGEEWPARTVTIIVPFPAGGSQDVIARMMAQHLEKALGRPFVVENRLGAGGNIGTAAAAKAAPDGYTFVLSSSGPLANNRFLYKNLGYDPDRDLAPVSLVGQFPMVIISAPNTQITDIKSYIARAGREPSLEIGTPGAGTMGALTASLLESATKTKVLHVPYAGGAPALNATVGNQIPLATDVVNGAVIGMISSGKVNGVAITSVKRFSGLPNLATAAEQGYPQIEAGVHFALVGPANLPAAIVAKLNGEIDRYIAMPETRAKLESLGAEVIGGKPEAVTAMVSDSLRRWQPIIQANGIEPR